MNTVYRNSGLTKIGDIVTLLYRDGDIEVIKCKVEGYWSISSDVVKAWVNAELRVNHDLKKDI